MKNNRIEMESGLKISDRKIEYLGFWKIVGKWRDDGRYILNFKKCDSNNEGLLG